MSARTTSPTASRLEFGIGQPVPRKEDPRLLRGEGRYTDDVNLPAQAHAVIVRSTYAHGILRAIEATDATAMPGVLAVYTGADLLAAGYGAIKPTITFFKNRDGTPMHMLAREALQTERVRYVGDPVACVVAETAAQARDAAETLVVDIEPLPAVTDAERACQPESPQLFKAVPNNVILDYHYGDANAVAAAFARAAHVTRVKLVNSRIIVNAMEPRSAIGQYDPATGRWTLHVGCQGVFGLRNQLAKDILQVAPEKVRVITENVGGSFGMKASVYPEYICLFHAARRLGRPVKWTDERSESFLADHHGRAHERIGELALDAEGNFLAVRITGYGNMGAFLDGGSPIPSTLNTMRNAVGVYKTPLIEVVTKCVVTNTTPVSAYRGAGRPEGNYYMERLVDAAAREIGIDRIELRRRNHIRPDSMPYQAPSGLTYDGGEFSALLEKALAMADWNGFEARKTESRRRGLLRGRGIGNYLEATAPPSNEMGGIRFEADGSVTIVTGTLDYGQGHASPFAQVLTEKLGVPFERIRLLQGDSDQLIAGGGTGGSKSMMASGTAIVEASQKVIERGKQIAAHHFETAVQDIAFADGRFSVSGTDRVIGIMELAEKIRNGLAVPADLPQSLDVAHIFESAPAAFPNGCHIAEVEVDPETGVAKVVKYSMVNDFGTLINPLLVAGQAHGGVVQGIGQALMEVTRYDADGQLLTGSYMDYAMPRATDAPDFRFDSHPVPAKTNPLGVKGCGEAGCAGSLPAVMNALIDALAERGVRALDMPATPERIWQALNEARA
ncbi:MAG: xanthine dehydrogenase family protein molybdopterin-binding subunit [Proteobacteria bacterium]|nr:xanthine dehydrogenase family protein molybdopterin-binding subunit [Pseudomonadota bacterium]MBI3497164.1 xanthine dehydrogenase family protein molybdopterin-binding subunit [Pseudomonadota bacterium]